MEYKCKICAGSLSFDSKSRIAICDYCGTKQVLPLFSDESAQRLYDRGNNYLLQNEYDKAENLFSQLLSISPEDPEIYWNLVLCKYGVTFVKDPQTDKYIPTCNRTHFQSVFQDDNYIKTLEYSDNDKKEYYKENATTIDNIQRGILSVSKQEKPFDIFISYKETDADGSRTKDSIEAQKLYDKLTEAGYKVFFSRITLENKIGTEYEPYIYAALHSSKVMLTICSSKENIESAWVKNEWSRFLVLRQNDSSKTLIPLYFDMSRSDLPEEFAILSVQDMAKDDFEQELLRGIKKLIPLPILKAKRRKKMRKTIAITVASLCVVGGGATAIILPGYLKNQKYSTAMTHYKNAEYEEAAELFAELDDYENSKKMVEQCNSTLKYDNAMQLYNDGKYQEALEIFSALEDFEDSKKMVEQCDSQMKYDTAMQLYNDGKYQEALKIFSVLADFKDSEKMIEKCNYQPEYDAALQLYYDGNYPEAAWAFSNLDNYEDSKAMQEKCELYWREDVSTVATQVDMSSLSYGSYYISPNGTVETFTYNPGSLHKDIKIDEHGKIVSIEDNFELYALHEDGYVTNSKSNNKLDKDWENIIQITPRFNATNVALTNEGKVVFGNLQDEFNPSQTDDWLTGVSEWNGIVELSYGIERAGGLSTAVLLGLNKDGTVEGLFYSGEYTENDAEIEKAKAFIQSLTNIKSISACVFADKIGISAINKDGEVFYFINGETQTKTGNFVAAEIALDDKYKMYLQTLDIDRVCGKYKDVVSISNGGIITASGSLYFHDDTVNTAVKDVWLLRK